VNRNRRRAWVGPSLIGGCLAAGVLLTAGPLDAQAPAFEGAVTMRELYVVSAALSAAFVANPDSLTHLSLADLETLAAGAGAQVERAELTYYVSGSRLRSAPAGDSTASPEYLIADFAEGLYRVVDPAQGLIVEWRDRTAPDGDASGGDPSTLDPDIAGLGRSREINGFAADGWMLRYGTAIVEVSWLTAELDDLATTFAQLAVLSEELGSGGESRRSIQRLLDRGFPVRTVTADAGSGTLSAAEITAIERRALPADTFEAPAGYLTVTVER
jgi:hypothetical protein